MADPRLDSYSAVPWLDVHFNIPAGAAAADYDGAAFIAPFPCEVLDVRETHQTAGTDAGAVTVDIMKVPSGTAKASGTSTLASALSLKTTADTPQAATLSATLANRRLAENDRIAAVTAGTLTAVDGVHVQVLLRAR